MKLENKVGLVRFVITVSDKYLDSYPATAYTFWHRHDEPDLVTKLNAEASKLLSAYDDHKNYGASVEQEWMEYKS